MENKEVKGQQAEKEPVETIINYIDDAGNKHRIYTTSKEVEYYIRRTYDVIESNPQKNLTS